MLADHLPLSDAAHHCLLDGFQTPIHTACHSTPPTSVPRATDWDQILPQESQLASVLFLTPLLHQTPLRPNNQSVEGSVICGSPFCALGWAWSPGEVEKVLGHWVFAFKDL